ncbi:Aste57867_18843 [Aphanomyces stellatus]|uniref:Aste57867_18843 protein n=1 Tax=Aphanomyces stellatus TaxID=120398 RepID=A0A485LBC9_9STRA|nr:hypothetical protein As57867_018779 [Aphanomyces stellatus]VFT95577.1 Aste57867_18843 [Aphanomyces stellatus]
MMMRRGSVWRVSALVLVLVLHVAHASVFSGFQIGREFSYLGKFCFTWDPDFSRVVGEIHAQVRTPDDGVKLAIYDDQDEFWNFVTTDPACDCACKLSDAHTKAVFDIPRGMDAAGHIFTLNYTIREHLRPRFWYVALAKCVPHGDAFHPTSLADLTVSNFQKYYFTAWYNLHMLQSATHSEVPVYQEDLDVVYFAVMLLSGGLLALQLRAAAQSRHMESFHPIIQLVTALVAVAFAANAALCVHFVAFTFNGMGAPLLLCLARVLQAMHRVGMLLLAMLVAKGWTINSITLDARHTLTTVMVIYFVLYLSLATWYLGFVDPSSTLYMYDSVPGVGICLLQLAVYAWFLVQLHATRAKEVCPAKRMFFFQMGLLFTVYILSLPVIVLVASVLSPWVREKIVESVTICIEWLTSAVLVYLLWPTRAPKYFDRLYSLVGSHSEKATLCDATLPTNQL